MRRHLLDHGHRMFQKRLLKNKGKCCPNSCQATGEKTSWAFPVKEDNFFFFALLFVCFGFGKARNRFASLGAETHPLGRTEGTLHPIRCCLREMRGQILHQSQGSGYYLESDTVRFTAAYIETVFTTCGLSITHGMSSKIIGRFKLPLRSK